MRVPIQSPILWLSASALVASAACFLPAEDEPAPNPDPAAQSTGGGCGQGAADAAAAPQEEGPGIRYSSQICPQYVWMDWGTYCSYYALTFGDCSPLNHDDVNCSLFGDCMGSGGGCFRFAAADRHPGSNGYGGVKKARRAPTDTIPGFDPAKVAVVKLDDFVIRFTVRGSGPPHEVSAQIFIVQVTSKKPDEPPAILARGLEIEPDSGAVRHDYTGSASKGPQKTPGMGHHFTYEYGQLSIPIITHERTPGHGG